MPFGVSLLAFAVVFVVIDLVDRLSAFIDREVGLGTILSYYLCYLPYIVVLVLPMAVLLAGLFCMGGLIQRGELLAMKSAGISLYQIVIPLQMLALGISLLAVAMADQVVPRANRARSKIEQPRQSAIGPQSIRVQVALRDTVAASPNSPRFWMQPSWKSRTLRLIIAFKRLRWKGLYEVQRRRSRSRSAARTWNCFRN